MSARSSSAGLVRTRRQRWRSWTPTRARIQLESLISLWRLFVRKFSLSIRCFIRYDFLFFSCRLETITHHTLWKDHEKNKLILLVGKRMSVCDAYVYLMVALVLVRVIIAVLVVVLCFVVELIMLSSNLFSSFLFLISFCFYFSSPLLFLFAFNNNPQSWI